LAPVTQDINAEQAFLHNTKFPIQRQFL